MTNFEKIKSMTVEKMTEWIKDISDDERDTWEPIGCYHCVNYGTHHQNPRECGDCEWISGIRGWLEREVLE